MADEGEKASWLEPLPEEFTTGNDMTGRRMLTAALTVIILAIFGGLIWYSYLAGTDNGPVPVVHADKSVVKEKPDSPGGLQVPDQDKGVFNRVASGQKDNGENLEAGAELPIERPIDTKSIETAKKKALQASEDAAQALPPPQTETVANEVAAIAPASDGLAGNFLVQLGAFGKKDTAEQLWARLQKDNPDLLRGLRPDIMMIDLGKKGVLYRLRGGRIVDRLSAGRICAALKTKKQACIVVEK
ncbi:MAG: hypothetical protein COB49_05345 [Alphaproteobacteria bacterium]|nr:MAG: hypothetical protein COB49_05345 [Alphaproteobacteria bacterium]